MKRMPVSGICGFAGSTIALRLFDVPWLAPGSSRAGRLWGLSLTAPPEAAKEIADHARKHPDWPEISTL